ncbi:MAG: LysE family transporter [Nevskia sp.]|nr:LysE family transporter [Nevskia sp.]
MTDPVSLFAAVAAAHGLAVMSPGPDFVMVSRQTLAHGRAAGLRTAWGVACGIAVHVAYGLFGLAWAIHHYPPLLQLLRYAGAALLLWIGWNALRAQPAPLEPAPATAHAASRDFGIGFATNALNVKAMLFFVALCSAVLSGQVPATLRLALGAWMILATGAWFSFLAWTLGHPRVRQRLRAWSHWIERGMGMILLLLGVAMLVESLRA